MKIQLIDINESVCKAWEHAFKDVENVSVHNCDLFALPTDCVVSAANSFGFMDGGVDAVISRRLPGIQDKVQARLKEKYRGELVVGRAMLVATKDKEIPYLISAPTMRYPKIIANTENVYLAAKAMFYIMKFMNKFESNRGKDIVFTVPGLGTSTGRVMPDIATAQMRHAYNEVFNGVEFPKSWKDVKMRTQVMFKKYEHTSNSK